MDEHDARINNLIDCSRTFLRRRRRDFFFWHEEDRTRMNDMKFKPTFVAYVKEKWYGRLLAFPGAALRALLLALGGLTASATTLGSLQEITKQTII